ISQVRLGQALELRFIGHVSADSQEDEAKVAAEVLEQRLDQARLVSRSRHPKVQALESAFAVSQVLRETKLAVQRGLNRRKITERNRRAGIVHFHQQHRIVRLRMCKLRQSVADQLIGNRRRK